MSSRTAGLVIWSLAYSWEEQELYTQKNTQEYFMSSHIPIVGNTNKMSQKFSERFDLISGELLCNSGSVTWNSL